MRKIVLSLVLLFILLFYYGCITTPGFNSVKGNTLLDEESAYIIGRFKIEGSGKFQFKIVDKFTNRRKLLHFSHTSQLTVIRTEPGLYQIQGIRCSEGTLMYGPDLSTISLWEDFELKGGDVMFIGSYTIQSGQLKKRRYATIPIEVKDDLPQIIEEFHSSYQGTDFMFVRSLFLE